MRVLLWLGLALCAQACTDKNLDACTIAKDGTDDCRYLNTCDARGCCVHKDVMPLMPPEAGGTILVFVISGMANAGGVGGGPIMTAFEILLFYFNPKQAIPLSQVIIVAGGAVSFAIRCLLRHPTRDRPLLEYNISTVIIPPILIGSTFGVMVNKILPNVAILVMLTIVLIFITWLTTKNGIKAFRAEQKQRREEAAAKAKEGDSDKSPKESVENATIQNEFQLVEGALLQNEDKPIHGSPVAAKQPDDDQAAIQLEIEDNSPTDKKPEELKKEVSPELAAILKRESKQFPLLPCIWITFVVAYVALGLSIRGGSGTSFAEIVFCGEAFKIFFALWSFGLLIITVLPVFYVMRLRKTYDRIGYEYDQFDIRWTLTKAIEVWVAGFFGGFGGGLLGFGASLLVAPVLVQWKIRSPIIGPTAALLTVIGSAISVMQFAEQKSLVYDYAGWLALCGFCGALVGVVSITRVMKKLGRNSILVLILASVLAIAMFLVPIYTLVDIIKKEKSGKGNYALQPYCG